jgi:hypothetical protein
MFFLTPLILPVKCLSNYFTVYLYRKEHVDGFAANRQIGTGFPIALLEKVLSDRGPCRASFFRCTIHAQATAYSRVFSVGCSRASGCKGEARLRVRVPYFCAVARLAMGVGAAPFSTAIRAHCDHAGPFRFGWNSSSSSLRYRLTLAKCQTQLQARRLPRDLIQRGAF